MDILSVTALFPDLSQVEVTNWVERGWVIPDTAETGFVFHEIDIARVRLIHDLRRDMEIGEDAISLVLSLLDQVYELRSQDEIRPARPGNAAPGCPGRHSDRRGGARPGGTLMVRP